MDWHGYSSEQIAINNYLEHHGVKGQRWGVRRYQNPDGTLTEAGKKKLRSLNKTGINAVKSSLVGGATAAATTLMGAPISSVPAAAAATIAYNRQNKALRDKLKSASNAYATKKEISKVDKKLQKEYNRVEDKYYRSRLGNMATQARIMVTGTSGTRKKESKSIDYRAADMYNAMHISLAKIGRERLKADNVNYTELERRKKQNAEIKKSINEVLKKIGDRPLMKYEKHGKTYYSKFDKDKSGKGYLEEIGWKY